MQTGNAHDQKPFGLRDLFEEDAKRFRELLQRLLVCNPFYLLSAMTLLGGIYLLWQDAEGLSEWDRLQMNFLTLQAYEWLLVATVVMLARRKIWYDATLLVALENLLLAVPFILLSQATWLAGEASRATLLLAGAGALLAVGRLAVVRRWFGRLVWPRASLIIGAVVLTVHIALPVIFKLVYGLGETPAVRDSFMQTGLVLAAGVLLPVLIGLLVFLPRPASGAGEACDHWWLPWLFGVTWLSAAAYHIWALGYVYDVQMQAAWCLPAVWALMWVVYARRTWLLGHLSASDQTVLAALPMVVILGAFESPMSYVLMGCSLINAAVYAWLAQRRRQPKLMLMLMAISLAGSLAYIPAEAGSLLVDSFTRTHAVVAAILMLILLLAPVTRSVWLGLLAGGGVTAVAWLILERLAWPTELAWQIGAVFVLMHSLRWHRRLPWLANGVRAVIAGSWLLASLKWLHFADGWLPVVGSVAPALVLFGAYAVHRFWLGEREPRIVLYAALGILLLQPLYPVLDIVVEAGPAFMTLAAAFVLFAMGTVLAWNRQAWLEPQSLEVSA